MAEHVTARPQLRPPDPAFGSGLPPRTGRYSSAQAMRLLAHCYFRDCWSALDLTFGSGLFWKSPVPPGLTITTNNLDPSSRADLHLDFTDTGLPDGSYDLAVYDPPHLADLGAASFMRARFGTARSEGFRAMIEGGALEAWRIARVGILVKLADGPHGGRYQQLTRWVEGVIPVPPVFELHAIGRPTPRSAGEISRVPRGNDASWLVFRRDGHGGRYPDFIRQDERQAALQVARERLAKRCVMCNAAIGDRRRDVTTCSPACRQRAYRERERRARVD